MLALTCNHCIWEVEPTESRVHGEPGLCGTLSKTKQKGVSVRWAQQVRGLTTKTKPEIHCGYLLSRRELRITK